MPVWILTTLLIGLAGNLDNLGVGVAYGARRIGIPFLSNLLIAVVATVGTGFLAYAGASLKHLLSPAVAGAVSAACIIAVGFWVLWARRVVEEPIELVLHPEEADVDHSGDISLSEALALSIGLGVNAWAGGFSGGLVGVPAWAIALATGGFSIATLWAGERVGNHTLGHWLGARGNVVAGVLLILVGVKNVV